MVESFCMCVNLGTCLVAIEELENENIWYFARYKTMRHFMSMTCGPFKQDQNESTIDISITYLAELTFFFYIKRISANVTV